MRNIYGVNNKINNIIKGEKNMQVIKGSLLRKVNGNKSVEEVIKGKIFKNDKIEKVGILNKKGVVKQVLNKQSIMSYENYMIDVVTWFDVYFDDDNNIIYVNPRLSGYMQ